MLAPADALSLAVERGAKPERRHVVAPSVQDHGDVSEFDESGIGRDTFAPYNHRGTVIVACAWLAFYAIAAIYHS
jgi:hypothetical protein